MNVKTKAIAMLGLCVVCFALIFLIFLKNRNEVVETKNEVFSTYVKDQIETIRYYEANDVKNIKRKDINSFLNELKSVELVKDTFDYGKLEVPFGGYDYEIVLNDGNIISLSISADMIHFNKERYKIPINICDKLTSYFK